MKFDCLKKNKILLGIFIISVIFFMTISAEYFGASIPYIFIFIIYVVVYIQIPGDILIDSLHLQYDNLFSQKLIAFFSGCAILIIEYYCFSIICSTWGIILLNPSISIIYIGIKMHNQGIKNTFNVKGNLTIKISMLLFIVLILTLFLFNMQFQYMSPEKVEFSSLGQDFVWHMGNINALATSFPPSDPRVGGAPFYYHYFQDLIYGICLKIFGIPADVLHYTCSPYLLTYIFGGSLLAFFKEFCHKGNRAEWYALFFVILNFCPMGVAILGEKFTESWLNIHIFSNVNCVAFSMAAILIFIVSLKYYKSYQSILISMLIMFMATGLKGPMALVLILGIIIALLSEVIFTRCFDQYQLLLSLGSIFTFGIVYLFVISGFQSGRTPKGTELSISMIETIQRGPVYNWIINYLPDNQIWLYYVGVGVVVLLEMIGLVSTIAIPYLFYMVLTGKNIFTSKCKIPWERKVVYFSILIGIGGFLFVNQDGFSQIYFLFAVIPLMYLEVICIIENLVTYSKIKRSIILATVGIGAIVSISGFMQSSYDICLSAWQKCFGNTKVETQYFYTGMLKEEYDGWLWIRNHTSKDSVIATDRRNITRNNQYQIIDGRYYYGSAYSQRKVFLEGSAYSSYASITEKDIKWRLKILKKIYDEKNNRRGQIARNNGIDYIVVTKAASGDIELTDQNLEMCYHNNQVKIYKLK